MIVLFTDFGLVGPYVGQMHAMLAQQAPGVPVIDLFHDVPVHDVRAGAYLLPAYASGFPPATVFVCVVDPGVGGARRPLMVRADQHWYVGPDNGLMLLVARRARECEAHEILWRPPRLSASFHGRDLFAPVAAMLVRGQRPESTPREMNLTDTSWPDDLAEIIYIDRFGNALTGLRAGMLAPGTRIQVGEHIVVQATTFEQVPRGQSFWYENSNGLVELAVNQGRAAERLRVTVGARVTVLE